MIVRFLTSLHWFVNSVVYGITSRRNRYIGPPPNQNPGYATDRVSSWCKKQVLNISYPLLTKPFDWTHITRCAVGNHTRCYAVCLTNLISAVGQWKHLTTDFRFVAFIRAIDFSIAHKFARYAAAILALKRSFRTICMVIYTAVHSDDYYTVFSTQLFFKS